MRYVLTIHKNDGSTIFLFDKKDWKAALDWKSVSYEKIYNGYRLVIGDKTVGVLVGKEPVISEAIPEWYEKMVRDWAIHVTRERKVK